MQCRLCEVANIITLSWDRKYHRVIHDIRGKSTISSYFPPIVCLYLTFHIGDVSLKSQNPLDNIPGTDFMPFSLFPCRL
jgi:hypothetical protein